MSNFFLAQAEANRAINEKWYGLFLEMEQAELEVEQGAFFGSIFGTLNHILLGDRIWLGRFSEQPFAFERLSDRICETMEKLAVARAATDEALVALTAGEADFGREFSYQNSSGTAFTQPLDQALNHLFAHQHHHRGQISQMCHERKIAIPDGGTIAYTRIPNI